MQNKIERVAFGGGCFWCTEAVFLILKGVVAVTPGYAGGDTKNPTYQQVSSGKTGHAEVILVEYDPKIISFDKLVEVFLHPMMQLNLIGRATMWARNTDQFYFIQLKHRKKSPNFMFKKSPELSRKLWN